MELMLMVLIFCSNGVDILQQSDISDHYLVLEFTQD